jgi:hypothetical protein
LKSEIAYPGGQQGQHQAGCEPKNTTSSLHFFLPQVEN